MADFTEWEVEAGETGAGSQLNLLRVRPALGWLGGGELHSPPLPPADEQAHQGPLQAHWGQEDLPGILGIDQVQQPSCFVPLLYLPVTRLTWPGPARGRCPENASLLPQPTFPLSALCWMQRMSSWPGAPFFTPVFVELHQVLLLYKEVLPPWSDHMGYGREASSLGSCPHSCFPLHSSLSHEDYSSPGQVTPQALSPCNQVPPLLPRWPYSGEHSLA